MFDNGPLTKEGIVKWVRHIQYLDDRLRTIEVQHMSKLLFIVIHFVHN